MCEYKKYINISSFYVEIIGKCNLKCVYCYNDSTANSNAKIPLETIDKIIKYCKNNQIPIIEVSGGEPLLHEDFAQIMDHIYMSGRKARLVSNATFFPKQLHILEKYNPTIQTTLDGYNADINDKQRGEKSFEKILSGIECLLNSKYDGKLIVRHNISLNNRVYIREFVEFMYRLGIRNILFETINHMGRALENDGIIFDKGIFIKEYFETKELIDELREKYRDMDLQGIYDPVSTCGYFDIYHRKKTDISIRVDVNGDIFPCQFMDKKEMAIGNIYESSIEEIILNSRYEEFISMIGQRKKSERMMCNKCILYNYCNGGCPARAIMRCGDIMKTDGYCNLRKGILAKKIRSMDT